MKKMKKFCQSCGMPMDENSDLFGTKKDGSKEEDYCIFCFAEGEFTANISMEEMINICIPHIQKENKNYTREDARKVLEKIFPTLKRWKK